MSLNTTTDPDRLQTLLAHIRNGSFGLALGGGAVHGATHVGVLRALEEFQLQPTRLAGTSIGALIAALAAFQVPLDRIHAAALELDWLDISRLSWSGLGLLKNTGIAKVLDKLIDDQACIEDAKIPLAIVAADLASGERIVFKEGSLHTAVMASTAIPGIFAPVEVDGRFLVDGGLLENVPVRALREIGAEHIIAVDLSAKEDFHPPRNLLDVMTSAISLSIRHTSRLHTENAVLTIEPDIAGISAVDVKEIPNLIKVGYVAMREALLQL